MQLGMFFLALLTLVCSLGAVKIIRILAAVAGVACGIDTGGMSFSFNAFILQPQPGQRVYLSAPILAVILALLGLAGFIVYRLAGRGKEVAYKTWDCGYYKLDARNEYTATAFSKPFRIAFGFFLLPYRRTQKIWESFYHVKSFTYETHTTPVFRKYIYDPLLKLIFTSAVTMRRIQPGSIHLYLGYIFVTLLLLIVFMGQF
jgi:hydrogenase-4 component B